VEITQKDIAEKAGVTLKTVSRYFNNASQLAPKTRNILKRVCKELNYMPNSAARSIRNGRFNRIACLHTRKIEKNGREGIYTSQLQYINGMTNILAKNGYTLEISPVILDQRQETEIFLFPQFFSEFCIDGIICLPEMFMHKEIMERLAKLRQPSAWLNNAKAPEGWDRFLFDERAGAIRLVEYLIAKGRRNIVWFDEEPTKTHYSKRERRKGVKNALNKVGLRSDMEVIIPTKRDSQKYCADIFTKYPEVDAIISNLPFFFKSYEYLKEERERGNNFEATYFVSEWFAKDYLNEGVFIVTPETELGERAAEYVLAKINGKERKDLLKPLTPKLQINREFQK
jgi:DNA-binding LacI/PurR family transcriptional regulator